MTTTTDKPRRGDHIEAKDGRCGLVCSERDGRYLVRWDDETVEMIAAEQVARNFGH